MSLVDHLSELRIRIIRFLLVMGAFVICCYFYRKEILDLIKKPVEKPLHKYTAVSTAITEEDKKASILSDSYHCTCEKIVAIGPKEISKINSQAGKNENYDSSKKDGPGALSEIREKEPHNWLGKAQGALFDFIAYFQVMLGGEPTASPHYREQESGYVKTMSYAETLHLNCQCRLMSKDGNMQKGLHSSMVYIGLPELFFAHMKAAIFAGFFLAFPYLLIEVWGFIGPALYQAEKKIFWIFAITSYISFIGGSLFGYLIVFPFGFDFFLSLTQPDEIMPSLSVGEYLNLSIKLLLAFGFVFEMPLVTFILARFGIITPKLMVKQARMIILVIFILSAFLTPPDPFTMVLMAGPLIMLYIFSIFVCFLGVDRKKAALRKQGFEGDAL